MKALHLLTAAALSSGLLGLSGVALAQEQAAAQNQGFFFFGDMVRGRPREGATGPTCVLTSQFMRGESVVWRVLVQDAAGKELTDEDLQSVVAELPDGQSFEMEYGPHPRQREDDYFWATSWHIPADYPTGTFGYRIVVTDKAGKTAEWTPFNIETSKLMVIPGEVTYQQ